jgi:hypothetical protein
MTSAARIAANRRNALASTGPRTSAGKARSAQNAQASTGPRTPAGKAVSAQNARRHGLTLAAAGDPAWSEEIEAMAHTIAGADADDEGYDLACRIAEAQIDVVRARGARADLYAAFAAALEVRDTFRLAAIGDYERRALARRKFAIREFDAHRHHEWLLGKRTEPNPSAGAIRENEANPTRAGAIRENEVNPTAQAIRENEPNPILPRAIMPDAESR